MIYTLHELQHAANAPLKFWAETSQQLFTNPFSPLAYLPHSSRVAAGSELMARAVRRYEKPPFGLAHTVIGGQLGLEAQLALDFFIGDGDIAHISTESQVLILHRRFRHALQYKIDNFIF